MNPALLPKSDERAVAAENASYRWAYTFISFGLLAVVVYRSFVRQEAPWDLLLLVVLAGGAGTALQASQRRMSWRWAPATLLACAVAAALAAVMIWARH